MRNDLHAPGRLTNRRSFLRSSVTGSLLFPGIMQQVLAASADPLQPRSPHFPAKAKRVIFLFMSGGVSHVDTFDPKPALFRDHGKEMQIDHPEFKDREGYERMFLKRPLWEFAPYGQCGTEVSTLFPHVGACMDDIALIRSMHTSHSNHYNASLGMHTGSFAFARPSMGSWVSYGLGTPNNNLPSFMVIAPKQTYAGSQVYASDFLPGVHQGMRVVPGDVPIANIEPRIRSDQQRFELSALRALNKAHLRTHNADPQLEARLRSFETAFGMQIAVPDAFDFSEESDGTLDGYGLERGQTDGFGWQCLAARRLAERGVPFIELIDTGSNKNWDSHDNMQVHQTRAENVDKPIAGLLKDLKKRGMLEDTLVVWTTEFGRTPFNSSPTHHGREHHSWAFSSWMAGAGVKGGIVHGATDEYGMKAIEKPVHVHDFHATILHLMGIHHEELTYRHDGRDYRLTDVHGKVIHDLLA